MGQPPGAGLVELAELGGTRFEGTGEGRGLLGLAVEPALVVGRSGSVGLSPPELRVLLGTIGCLMGAGELVSDIARCRGAAGRWVDAHGWVEASFFQHDSRDHDPQLHIHNPILNRAPGDEDDEWRTLDSRAIHKFQSFSPVSWSIPA